MSKSTEFENLISPHLDALYGYAFSFTKNKADAEDLVQESVLRGFRAFDSFKKGTNIKAWLFTIVRNTYISHWRKKKAHKEESWDETYENFSFVESAMDAEDTQRLQGEATDFLDDSKLEQILGDELVGALNALPEEFRDVIFLSDVQNLSYKDIAQILEIPIGTVRSRLARARGALQHKLWDYAVEKGIVSNAPQNPGTSQTPKSLH